jgi:hypothetical protein
MFGTSKQNSHARIHAETKSINAYECDIYIFIYIYILFLCTCYVLSRGSRPNTRPGCHGPNGPYEPGLMGAREPKSICSQLDKGDDLESVSIVLNETKM